MNIRSYFLSKYDNESFLLRQKAAALMYVTPAFIVLFVLVAAVTLPMGLSHEPVASLIAYMNRILIPNGRPGPSTLRICRLKAPAPWSRSARAPSAWPQWTGPKRLQRC